MPFPRTPDGKPRDMSRPLERLDLLVDERQDGDRLDQALAKFLHWRSRSSLHRLIQDGYVELTGRAARKSSRVRRGEIIVVHIPPSPVPVTDVFPDDFEVPIIHEDRWMLGVDKPAGLAVHPSGRRVHGTLIHFLHKRYRRPEQPEHDVIPRLMHRLDRETSGVVAIGLDEDFHGKVRRQFEERQVQKTYLAVVHGRPEQDEGSIDCGIGPNKRSAVRLKLEPRFDGTGMSALTDYRVLKSNGRYSLVEMYPRTGRTHQLRVHMLAIGCPLVGDKVYGVEDSIFLEYLDDKLTEESRAILVLDRHALHAARLEFEHPIQGERFAIEAPLPPDLEALIEG